MFNNANVLFRIYFRDGTSRYERKENRRPAITEDDRTAESVDEVEEEDEAVVPKGRKRRR